MWAYYDFIGSLGLENLYQASSLFQYRYWKADLIFRVLEWFHAIIVWMWSSGDFSLGKLSQSDSSVFEGILVVTLSLGATISGNLWEHLLLEVISKHLAYWGYLDRQCLLYDLAVKHRVRVIRWDFQFLKSYCHLTCESFDVKLRDTTIQFSVNFGKKCSLGNEWVVKILALHLHTVEQKLIFLKNNGWLLGMIRLGIRGRHRTLEVIVLVGVKLSTVCYRLLWLVETMACIVRVLEVLHSCCLL